MSRSLSYYLLGVMLYLPTPISYVAYFQKAILNPLDTSNQQWYDLHEFPLGVLILVATLFFMCGIQELQATTGSKIFLTWTLFLSMVLGIPNIAYSPAQNPGFLAFYAQGFITLSLCGLIVNGLFFFNIWFRESHKGKLVAY